MARWYRCFRNRLSAYPRLAMRRLIVLGLLVATAGWAPPASAQEMLLQMWPSLGMGSGLTSTDTGGHIGWSGRAGVHLVFGRWVVNGRHTVTDGAASRFDTGFGKARASYEESALLLGYTPPGHLRGRLVLSAGVARAWGQRVRARTADEDPCIDRLFGGCRAYYYEPVDAVWGLAVEAGAYHRAFWIVDYGLVLHANLNAERPFAGATLGLRPDGAGQAGGRRDR